MKSIKLSFTRVSTGNTGLSAFWFLVIALISLDDTDRREKRNRQGQPPRKTPSGPKPF